MYTTDVILSALMCATRSVYPWDIVIVREGNALFFDKRDGGPFDTVSVNENAADPPQDTPAPNPNNPAEKNAAQEQPTFNSATSLSLEATYINQNFCFQTASEAGPPPPVDFPHPNPFYGPDETDPLASCGYRYRQFDLGITEDEDIKLCVRTEVDAFASGAGNPLEGHGLVTVRALNEFDTRAQGAGGAPDWRTKLDSQRGAVVATEMKNNSCKLARWTVQSVLAGADLMKIGYVLLGHFAPFIDSPEGTFRVLILVIMHAMLSSAPHQCDPPNLQHSLMSHLPMDGESSERLQISA